MIELGYLGRALKLYPASFGELFHDHCTVGRMDNVVEWRQQENAMTGEVTRYPVRKRELVQVPLYWYTKGSDGRQYFCTYSGYGPSILAELKRRGLEVQVRELVDDGLGKPRLDAVKDVQWRRRQGKVVSTILAYRRGRIVCPTAFGKTFIARQLAKVYPDAEIVLTVPFAEVAREIYRDLRFEMGRQVGMVGGGKNQIGRLTVAVSKSLHKCPKDVNLVLADECHALLTEEYIKQFNRFTRARLIGLTASPTGRSDGADAFGEALFGPILVDVSYQDAEAGGNVVPITVRMYDVPEGPDVSNRKDQTYIERVGIWLNDRRNRRIVESVRAVENELGPEAQILIMVDKTEHAYALGQLLPDYAVVTGEPTPTRIKQMRRRGAMTKDQEPCTDKQRLQYKQEFEDHRLKRAIATKIWRQGVNFRDLACLVRADGKASPIDSIQVPGRLSRLGNKTQKEAGLLIDFMDSFSSNLANRARKRMQVYRRNGWQVEQR